MKFTIITPNKNGGRFLEEAIQSVLNQRGAGIDVEYIVLDGGSTDDSPAILSRYKGEISQIICESDSGPVSAINKGLKMATGEIIAWLNADDRYHSGTLRRVSETLSRHLDSALCFGACRIIDESGQEIRRAITRFKELFFPLSSQYAIQCLNYISQPAMFFRRSALEAAGLLRENLVAAWDYDLTLRLWRRGGGARVSGPPLADFRWHQESISGQRYVIQFQEEFAIARNDAGLWRLQTLLHWFVCWGIIASYTVMAQSRKKKGQS
jgi:glycosyltransferase involved in cell wall biosynthesis